MIIVAGGTGTLGTRLVPRLAEAGLAVRVLTRDPGRAQYLGPGVDVVRGDVRDPVSIGRALRGAGTVISAVHGFTGPRGVSPASVDRAGNANLIDAATAVGAAFVLISVVGASPGHPVGLFRAKRAAEETLRASGIPWTIVRATAFMETWASVMSQPLLASGKIPVFGRGDNPVNFVSAADVAALAQLAVTDPGLRGQVLELGGPDNLTFNQLAGIVQEATGCSGTVRHIPRPALHAMAWTAAFVKPALARQARAALGIGEGSLVREGRRSMERRGKITLAGAGTAVVAAGLSVLLVLPQSGERPVAQQRAVPVMDLRHLPVVHLWHLRAAVPAQLVSPFTGEPVKALGRVVVVKIDNIVDARLPEHLTSADIVYLLPVEGGLSRIFAVYSSRIPKVIGPVRSAREDDLELLRQFGRPGFAYSGAAPHLLPFIARAPAPLWCSATDAPGGCTGPGPTRTAAPPTPCPPAPG